MASPPERPAMDAGAAQPHELAAWAVQYGAALRNYFRKRAPGADADDLVQDVFLRLQMRSEVRPVDNVEGYLFKIAAHVLIDRHRHELARGLGLHDSWDETPDQLDEISPERALIGRQEHARAIVALRNLPPRARAAFALHRFERMTYPAIARRMGISLNAVKHLIARALDRLTEEMEQQP